MTYCLGILLLWVVLDFLKLGRTSPFCGHLEFLWYMMSKYFQDDEFACALNWQCVAKTNQKKRDLMQCHPGAWRLVAPPWWVHWNTIAKCFQWPLSLLLCIRWMTTGTAFISFTMLQQNHRERERQVGIIAIGTWDSLGHCRHMSHIDTPLFVFRCAALLETEGGDACAGKSGFWVFWEVRVAVSVSQYVRILHMFLPPLELKGAKYGSCFSGLWQQAAGKTSGKAAVLPQHTTGTTTVPLKLLRRSNQIASVDTRARLPCRVITYSEKSGKHTKTYSTLIDLDCHFPCFLGCYGSCMIVEQIWWYPRTLYAVEPCVLISILYEKESLLTSPGPYTLPYTKAFAWAAHAQCKWPCPVAEVRDNRCINRIYGLRWRLQEVDPCNPM